MTKGRAGALPLVSKTLAGVNSRLPPPAQAWIFPPERAMRTQHLGEFIRYDTVFAPALVDIAILVTAKYRRSHYECCAHRRLAETASLDAAIINAIHDGKPLPPCDEKTQVIYDDAHALHETKQIPLALHNRMIAAWGKRSVAEIVGTCGYYTQHAPERLRRRPAGRGSIGNLIHLPAKVERVWEGSAAAQSPLSKDKALLFVNKKKQKNFIH